MAGGIGMLLPAELAEELLHIALVAIVDALMLRAEGFFFDQDLMKVGESTDKVLSLLNPQFDTLTWLETIWRFFGFWSFFVDVTALHGDNSVHFGMLGRSPLSKDWLLRPPLHLRHGVRRSEANLPH